jgi:hypothetical protein
MSEMMISWRDVQGPRHGTTFGARSRRGLANCKSLSQEISFEDDNKGAGDRY